jgi:hypothetical protein
MRTNDPPVNPANVVSVEAYLAALPDDRRAVISAMRDLIQRHLPEGYQEGLHWGIIGYVIPLERYPDTYNGQPLAYLALAAQKNYYSLHLMAVYQNPERESWLKDEFRKAGKKLDMGKACLRFRSLDDLPLEVIGQLIASIPPERYIAAYEAARKKKP